MTASPAIQTVVGLILVFGLLGLAAAWLQELIAALLKLRSRTLVKALERLLDCERETPLQLKAILARWPPELEKDLINRFNRNPVKAFLEQPLIRRLQRVPGRPPSYIAPKDFAEALYELFVSAGQPDGESWSLDELEAFRKGVELINPGPAKRFLARAIQSAEATKESTEQKVAELRDRIASWYDGTMQRATGWYKRRAQLVGVLIGMVIAIALNVDTLRLASELWENASLRSSLESAAVVIAGEELPQYEHLTRVQERLAGYGLPVGWSNRSAGPAQFYQQRLSVALPVAGLIAFAGWAITAVAVAQGSGFWFDLLKKLVNMRGSGANPAEPSAHR